jgi:hypothetical protein
VCAWWDGVTHVCAWWDGVAHVYAWWDGVTHLCAWWDRLTHDNETNAQCARTTRARSVAWMTGSKPATRARNVRVWVCVGTCRPADRPTDSECRQTA